MPRRHNSSQIAITSSPRVEATSSLRKTRDQRVRSIVVTPRFILLATLRFEGILVHDRQEPWVR